MRFSFPFIAQFLGHNPKSGIECQLILCEIFQIKKNKARILYALAARQHGKTLFMKVLSVALMCTIVRGQETGANATDEFFRIYFSSKDNPSIESFIQPVFFEMMSTPMIIRERFKSLTYTKGEMQIVAILHSGHSNYLRGTTVGSKNRGIPYNIYIRDEVLYGTNISATFTENDRHSIAIKEQFETVMLPTVNVDRVVLNYCSAVTQTNPMHQMLRRLPLCCSVAWGLACRACVDALVPHACMHMMWRMCPTDKPIIPLMNLLLVPSDDVHTLFSKVQEEMCIPVPGRHIRLQSHLIENIFSGDECKAAPRTILEVVFAVDPCISQNPLAVAAAVIGRENNPSVKDEQTRILVVGGDSSPFRFTIEAVACVRKLMTQVLHNFMYAFIDSDQPITIGIIVEKQGGGVAANDYTMAMMEYAHQFIEQMHTAFGMKRVRPVVVYTPAVVKSRNDNDGMPMDEARWFGITTSTQSKAMRMDILTDVIKEGTLKYAPITAPQYENQAILQSLTSFDVSVEPSSVSSSAAKRRRAEPFRVPSRTPPLLVGGKISAGHFCKQSMEQLTSVFQGVQKGNDVTLDIPDVLAMIAVERIRCINTPIEI